MESPRDGAAREAGEDEAMYKGFRIKLSTMEMMLIGFLVGSLVLGLLQARQLERAHDAANRDLANRDASHHHH